MCLFIHPCDKQNVAFIHDAISVLLVQSQRLGLFRCNQCRFVDRHHGTISILHILDTPYTCIHYDLGAHTFHVFKSINNSLPLVASIHLHHCYMIGPHQRCVPLTKQNSSNLSKRECYGPSRRILKKTMNE